MMAARRIAFILAFIIYIPVMFIFAVAGLAAGLFVWVKTGCGFTTMDKIISAGMRPIDVLCDWAGIT
jgi:hypothetical protein